MNALCTTASGLVRVGVCSADEMDRAAVHMSRLVLSAGGVTGALVGVVGGGSVPASNALATDIMLGAPAGVMACLISWLLPPIFGWLCLRVVQFFAELYAGSPSVKRITSSFLTWWTGAFYERWDEHVKLGFEERSLRRMCALVKLDAPGAPTALP